MAYSCQCMAKITNLKKKSKISKYNITEKKKKFTDSFLSHIIQKDILHVFLLMLFFLSFEELLVYYSSNLHFLVEIYLQNMCYLPVSSELLLYYVMLFTIFYLVPSSVS